MFKNKTDKNFNFFRKYKGLCMKIVAIFSFCIGVAFLFSNNADNYTKKIIVKKDNTVTIANAEYQITLNNLFFSNLSSALKKTEIDIEKVTKITIGSDNNGYDIFLKGLYYGVDIYKKSNDDILVYSPYSIYAPNDCERFFNGSYFPNLECLVLLNFDTSQVISMKAMFYNLERLKSLDLSNFDTTNVLSFLYMFYNCSNLDYLNIYNFTFMYNESGHDLFYYTSPNVIVAPIFIKYLNLPTIYFTKEFNSSTNSFDTIEVTEEVKSCITFFLLYKNESECCNPLFMNLENGIANLSYFSSYSGNSFPIYYGGYDIPTIVPWYKYREEIKEVNFDCYYPLDYEYNMNYWFYDMINLATINAIKLSTKFFQVSSMIDTFRGCCNLSTINLDCCDLSKISDMSNMFSGCCSLTSVNFGKTDSIKFMTNMFSECYNLEYFDFKSLNSNSNLPNKKIKCIDMSNMFSGCTSLREIILPEVQFLGKDVSSMFSGCCRLSLIRNLCNLHESTNMSSMFSYCSRLTTLDLSNFNTLNLTKGSYMFYDCYSLEIENFVIILASLVEGESMFSNCSCLSNIFITIDSPNLKNIDNFFIGCEKMESIKINSYLSNESASCNNFFSGLENVKYIKITSNINGMFSSLNELECTSLRMVSLKAESSNKPNISLDFLRTNTALNDFNIGGFVIENKSLNNLFCNFEKLDFVNFFECDFSNTMDFSYMFKNCSLSGCLELEKCIFNYELPINFEGMFWGTSLDTEFFLAFPFQEQMKIENIDYLFYNCKW